MSRLSLFYPVKPFVVGQGFGESLACVKDYKLKTQKVVGKINGICPMGFEELYPKLGMKGHTGIDCQAIHQQNLYSCVDGVVSEISTELERGLGIDIITNEKFDFVQGNYYAKVRYWHLISIGVVKGQKINAGDYIGKADNTGFSAGDHLHFELKPAEMDNNRNFYNVFQHNGYYGAIDPMPYFNGYFSQDASTILGALRQIIELLKKMVVILSPK